jgi:hypothetical protein
MKKARLAVCLFVLAIVLQATTVAWASPLVVEPINNDTVDATSLAQMLAGDGVAVSDASYVGVDDASGTFSGGADVVGFGSGALLTSGDVQNVVGPNLSDSIGTDTTAPGDTDLDGLSANATEDASVLEFNFTTDDDMVFFQYVFASDEYNEYVNSNYNDAFGFFVNGNNCATIEGDPVTINTINQTSHAELYRNNDLQDGGGEINTEMDGLTTVLTCEASVNVSPATNHIKLAIADATDGAYDSAVFIEANSFTTTPPDRTLSVEVSGNGDVYSDPEAISCPGIEGPCSSQFADGSEVTLTATPDAGNDFAGWGGDCTGSEGNTCTLTMNADKTVTATFVVHQNTLTVTENGTGSGTVTSSPPGISCPPTCSAGYDTGTSVVLSAQAASGSTFSGWSGEGCTGTGTCTVTMNGNKSVTASFNQNTSNGTSGFVPPGGTIQTCQNTSSTDNTCSTITLPNTGPGAAITITEQAGSLSKVCNGPCSNQTTFYSITCTPATPCYTNVNSPVKVILRYRVPGTSTAADMYFQHSSTTKPFKIPNCLKTGIAKPNPCVSARNRLGFGNNDLQVQVLVTSDDPIIGKR